MTGNDTAIVATIRDREQTLTFVIRPMPPFEREQWLLRALRLCVNKADATEADYLAAGASLARTGIYGLFGPNRDADAVLSVSDDLLGCCFLMTEEGEKPCTPQLLEKVVEEVLTLFALKNTAMKQNLAFLLPVDDAPAAAIHQPPATEGAPA